ncbi:MAG: hypothetical protein BWX47_01230 [candidate division Hyd24-12 bacterium ADurb.Bin004]|nr:MAG: hypothetical protein BWX47_01230 [candidate division Hyd24-12 bacterium ADurb.Bin004]
MRRRRGSCRSTIPGPCSAPSAGWCGGTSPSAAPLRWISPSCRRRRRRRWRPRAASSPSRRSWRRGTAAHGAVRCRWLPTPCCWSARASGPTASLRPLIPSGTRSCPASRRISRRNLSARCPRASARIEPSRPCPFLRRRRNGASSRPSVSATLVRSRPARSKSCWATPSTGFWSIPAASARVGSIRFPPARW